MDENQPTLLQKFFSKTKNNQIIGTFNNNNGTTF